MCESSIKFSLFGILCMLIAPFSFAVETLKPLGEQSELILRQTAMPVLDETHLGKILNRHYNQGLGGPENWEKIESLRVTGSLYVGDRELEMAAYQKKPNLIKMTLVSKNGSLILGYDGEQAWRHLPNTKDESAAPMVSEEARRFVHVSSFGNFLLYPYRLGKTISFIDTVPLNGNICHQIRVTLETDFQIDYYIDIRTYLETKVVNFDIENQRTNSIIFSDYRWEAGMPVAQKVVNYENGQVVSQIDIEEVQVNTGVMPWMFKIPR